MVSWMKQLALHYEDTGRHHSHEIVAARKPTAVGGVHRRRVMYGLCRGPLLGRHTCQERPRFIQIEAVDTLEVTAF